ATASLYAEVIYRLQRLILDEEFAVFGTIANPAGCAVAYRRAYLDALFRAGEQVPGVDLTRFGDTLVATAMLGDDYRNVQVTDVCARTSPSRPFDTERWLLRRTLVHSGLWSGL